MAFQSLTGTELDARLKARCKDHTLLQLLLAAVHQPGVKARETARGLMVFGPKGSVLVGTTNRGGDPNQVKRTRGQLRRIGLSL